MRIQLYLQYIYEIKYNDESTVNKNFIFENKSKIINFSLF